MNSLLIGAYFLLVALVSVHGLHRLGLLWLSKRKHRSRIVPLQGYPLVTVQLPVYNERDVVGRLIDAVAALRWPSDRLQIQVLDDSNDDTTKIAAAALEKVRKKGIDVELLHRNQRSGFKAGALQSALATATGEFIAIFDADFVPDPGFLERMMGAFAADEVGMVQARWGHLNADHSRLTRAQALLLDGHFCVEHEARYQAGLCTHFNGTGGIWRKRCIEESGGWEVDTLTEDLDLSYRAQMAGWRFRYVLEEEVPGELPETFAAFRAQQARWARGSMQTARKLYWKILKSSLRPAQKLEAGAHLLANLAWVPGIGIAILLPLVELCSADSGIMGSLLNIPAFALSTATNLLYYALANPRRIRDVPLALLLGIGLGFRQSLAVWEGILGHTGVFVRTPKNGGNLGSYRIQSPLYGMEVAMALWSGWGLWVALERGYWGTVPFNLLFVAGFGWAASLGAQPPLAWARTMEERV